MLNQLSPNVNKTTCLRMGLVFLLCLTINLQGALSASPESPFVREFELPNPNAGPLAITVDPTGRVWFTMNNASKIGSLDPSTGRFLEYELPMKTTDMWGIIASKDGHVYFTEYFAPGGASLVALNFTAKGGSGRVWRLDPQRGSFEKFEVGEGSFPFRLAEDGQGRIWFTMLRANKIGVLDPRDGSVKEYAIPRSLAGPADIAIDPQGRVWFTMAYAHAIGLIDPRNGTLREFELPADKVFSPVGIAITPEGLVWLADHGSGNIARFDPRTGELSLYPTSHPPPAVYPVSLPNGLIITSSGEVWAAQHAGNKIARLDPSGGVLVEYDIPSGPISTTLWLAPAPDGKIWFAEYSANKIGFVDPSVPLPFSISAQTPSLRLQQGSRATLRLTVMVAQGKTAEGLGLRLSSAHTSIVQDSFLVSFTPNLVSPSMVGAEFSTDADITASKEVRPGPYHLILGASGGGLSYYVIVRVEVVEAAWRLDVMLLLIAVAFGLLALTFVWIRRGHGLVRAAGRKAEP